MTSLDEAIPLREAGVRANILLMTRLLAGEETEIVRLRLTPTVWEPWQIESMETAAKALGWRGSPSILKSILAWDVWALVWSSFLASSTC